MMEQAVSQVLEKGGARITGINGTTRDRVMGIVQETVTQGMDDGLSMAELGDRIEAELNDAATFGEYRSELIARTETMMAYNTAALSSYGEFGVERVQAIDGDDDEVCAERNGQDFSIEEAADIEDHPNGTLDWVPFFGEASAPGTSEQATATADETPSESTTLLDPATEVGQVEAGYVFTGGTNEAGSYYRIATGERLGEVERATENWVQMDRVWRGPEYGFTHSHPDDTRILGKVIDGRSFSNADVRIAIEENLGSFRAVSGEWVHEITRPTGGWPKWDKVRKLHTQERRRLSAESDAKITKAIAAGDKETVARLRATDEVEMVHLVWQALADEYGFPYTRKPRR